MKHLVHPSIFACHLQMAVTQVNVAIWMARFSLISKTRLQGWYRVDIPPRHFNPISSFSICNPPFLGLGLTAPGQNVTRPQPLSQNNRLKSQELQKSKRICYISFFLISFYWSIVDLQCCVSFCCTAKWISYIYIYIYIYISTLV